MDKDKYQELIEKAEGYRVYSDDKAHMISQLTDALESLLVENERLEKEAGYDQKAHMYWSKENNHLQVDNQRLRAERDDALKYICEMSYIKTDEKKVLKAIRDRLADQEGIGE